MNTMLPHMPVILIEVQIMPVHEIMMNSHCACPRIHAN